MKTIILDRDGVINRDSEHYIRNEDEWIPLPGSLEAIAKLHAAGYRVVVASNQSGLGRKLFDEFALARIHHKMCSMVEEAGGIIDGIFYCPHTPDDNCQCRKPATGLLQQVEREFSCDLSESCFIGDSLKDIEAATAYGLKPVLVRTGNGNATARVLQEKQIDVAIHDDLLGAVKALCPDKDD